MRILIVTTQSYPGHERRNLPLASELIRRGHRVRHVCPSVRINQQAFAWSCFPDQFERLPEAAAANTRLFHSWRDLEDHIAWADVVLFGTGKGYEHMGRFAQQLGKVVVQHHDIGSLDPYTASPDAFAVRGEWYRRALLARNVPLELPPVSTGCVQLDDAAPINCRLDREAFCRKYGLDPSRPIATYLTAGPAHHTPIYLDTQAAILRAMEAAGMQAIYRPHPNDYSGTKMDRYYGPDVRRSWETLPYPVLVPDAEDKYDAFRHSCVIIGRGSTTALETPFVRRPMLIVDVPDLYVGEIWGRPLLKDWFPAPRFSAPRRQPFRVFGDLTERLDEVPDPDVRAKLQANVDRVMALWGLVPDYVGAECTVEELPEILASGAYRFDDDRVYDQFVAEYGVANDGKAYLRVADALETFLADPGLAAKARKASRSRLVHRVSLPAGRAIRDTRRKLGQALARLRGQSPA